MNKKALIGLGAGLGVAAGIAACVKSGRCEGESQPKPTVWDKMQKGMDEMPDDFPLRVAFDDIEAMKRNTDEILALLQQDALAAAAAG